MMVPVVPVVLFVGGRYCWTTRPTNTSPPPPPCRPPFRPPLKAYSVADPRVKELAYVVKHWAKRRCVNNASEGTLSSYGYLLCLVHFLQTRNPPVVPNLQVNYGVGDGLRVDGAWCVIFCCSMLQLFLVVRCF